MNVGSLHSPYSTVILLRIQNEIIWPTAPYLYLFLFKHFAFLFLYFVLYILFLTTTVNVSCHVVMSICHVILSYTYIIIHTNLIRYHLDNTNVKRNTHNESQCNIYNSYSTLKQKLYFHKVNTTQCG